MLVAQGEAMKLINIAVHPEHSGKGVGRILIALCQTEARRQGYQEIRFCSHVAIPENIDLYQDLGWQEAARNGNVVSMTKQV
ncbi:GNAT family N-acetyltransferase [Cohaesibacter celericrescens]|uniref:GNAT family N-acetyltransferase n=1 Tax=Cohaesibacter celericrescens TaxID=2067669 RepID=UPI001FDF4119|nr:GNAT family N-acetyltransferase [Cohaesibacter celericrescens]